MTWEVDAPPWVTKGTYCIGEVDSDVAIAQTFICDEEERHAHLIAAAPELLEAAKAIVGLSAAVEHDPPIEILMLERAIEKAEGKE